MRGFGFGFGMALGSPAAGLSLVWSDDDIGDWSPVNMAIGSFAGTDPETGLGLKRAFETVTDGNHYISKDLPLETGLSYRLRVLLKGEQRSVFQLYLPTADAGKYWIGSIGSATPDLASGLTDATVEAVGDMYAHTVDFTLAGASGNYPLNILACIPGPNNSYPGNVSKGLVFGNVKLYDITP